ncbi:unnamed protein product [Meloidogyne enterolobii]|uniref:Uncharacterized protein n=1 Tax=Meloidogyne enterolobii TaxID=390850 RepID=A0ACB1B167_MELEN
MIVPICLFKFNCTQVSYSVFRATKSVLKCFSFTSDDYISLGFCLLAFIFCVFRIIYL